MTGTHPLDTAEFIRANFWLTPVPGRPDITLYTAHSSSGLGRLLEATGGTAPYWAYPWAGGLALALYLRDHPEVVAGRRVLDLGAGSGLVAIAAARAGAAQVMAAEIDPNGLVALRLNAELNGVVVDIVGEDLLDGPVPEADAVLVGDLFYDPATAIRAAAFLGRCVGAGLTALVGDPGRAFLPLDRLTRIAEYGVADVGTNRDGTSQSGVVFSFAAYPMGQPA